jgi:hypothetical protein
MIAIGLCDAAARWSQTGSAPPMSGLPPIATELVRRNELTRSAAAGATHDRLIPTAEHAAIRRRLSTIKRGSDRFSADR